MATDMLLTLAAPADATHSFFHQAAEGLHAGDPDHCSTAATAWLGLSPSLHACHLPAEQTHTCESCDARLQAGCGILPALLAGNLDARAAHPQAQRHMDERGHDLGGQLPGCFPSCCGVYGKGHLLKQDGDLPFVWALRWAQTLGLTPEVGTILQVPGLHAFQVSLAASDTLSIRPGAGKHPAKVNSGCRSDVYGLTCSTQQAHVEAVQPQIQQPSGG